MSKKLENFKEKLSCCFKNMQFIEHEPLSKHTSFKIGGSCPLLIEPKGIEELTKLIMLLKECKQKYYVIGAGTNLLVSDKGTSRVIIKLGKKFSKCEATKNYLNAFSGISLRALNKVAIAKGLSGLEWSYGIPGTLGGAIYMNAGAYGGQISNLVDSVVVFDGKNLKTLPKNKLKFSYRKSLFQKTDKFVIISAKLKLQTGSSEQIELQCRQNMQKRKEAHPLNMPSAGSVFKRNKKLIISKAIDELGLKGYTIGGAQISPKHAGFIVNTGEATSKDVKALIKFIKKQVAKKYKTKLDLEVRILGD